MTSERPDVFRRHDASPDPVGAWRGDVGDGVAAWVGRAPDRVADPDPAPDGPDADPESVARKILLDQLTGRARTRSELRGKLAARNVPDELAERLLDRFEEVGLVDDVAFARAWVESRQSGRGLAPGALSEELRRKGVAAEVIREAVGEIDRTSQESVARELVRKKLRSMRTLDHQTATRRLAGMLARKGYSSALCFAVVRAELDAAREGSSEGEAD